MRPVFSLLAKLRAAKARKAFLAYTADIDRRIEQARQKHQPTAHLIQEKRRIVHATVRA